MENIKDIFKEIEQVLLSVLEMKVKPQDREILIGFLNDATIEQSFIGEDLMRIKSVKSCCHLILKGNPCVNICGSINDLSLLNSTLE